VHKAIPEGTATLHQFICYFIADTKHFIPYDFILVWRHHLKVAVFVNSEESSHCFGTQPVFNINYKERPKADCWICW